MLVAFAAATFRIARILLRFVFAYIFQVQDIVFFVFNHEDATFLAQAAKHRAHFPHPTHWKAKAGVDARQLFDFQGVCEYDLIALH